MILTRAEGRNFSNEPKADLNFVEDGIYPASFVKCTEEQGKFGPQIKWLFTLDEVSGLKIFVSIYTAMGWAPGNKLDSFLVAMGIDTTNNFDINSFNTDSIAKGTKLLLMVQKKQSKSTGNVYLGVSKWLPYSVNARGAEPLDFPKEHIIMPESQPMAQGPQLNVNYQPQNFGQQPQPQFQQQAQPQYQPAYTPNPGMQRVTNIPTGPAMPQVKKVDFNSNL